ncbi:hypothetical protein BGW36DRAFT_365635 [Talaromyces proteolyticus]|uniref:Methyltransferase domain-containing protein n=1 Tax=Talaromyces proteolyticus TaxID=1131652 RepID=A0AAD4PTQ8_9EURO|nr:uncharacterized protein BGW36DRAFT_365635 [Talaromyces proteolyticus]KAH8689104.1 hypothetical protein BGW36DRAFT_365635 [Talaromyces proteolyticus]
MQSSSDGKSNPGKRIKGAPDYDDAGFWDAKFVTGQDIGEWLNTGEVLLDATISHIEQKDPLLFAQSRNSAETRSRSRILHLGPGISTLGARLCTAFVQRGWRADGIVNVDFSAEAVRLGRQVEEEKGDPAHVMGWVQADLCSWEQVLSTLSSLAPVDVIVDKSTSDAIATSVPRTFDFLADENSMSPIIKGIINRNKNKAPITLLPVELLGLHLASLTRKGAVWLVLSYSATRFDNFAYLHDHWNIASRMPLKAPAGQTVSAAAMVPEVFHWFYVLERK